MEGIKETKEAGVFLIKLVGIILKLAKDGLQLTDAIQLADAFANNEELKAALKEAADGIDKVGAEIGDLKFPEIMELLMSWMPEVVKAIEAQKK